MEVLRLTTIFLRPSVEFAEGSIEMAIYEGERPNPGPDTSPISQSPGALPFNPGGQVIDLPLPDAALDQLWFMVWGQVWPATPPVCLFNARPSSGTEAFHPPGGDDRPPMISLADISASNGISGRLEAVDVSQPLHVDDGYPPNKVGYWALDLVSVTSAPMAPGGLSVE